MTWPLAITRAGTPVAAMAEHMAYLESDTLRHLCIASTDVMHCAQFKRGPKIFRKGTKKGPDFEQKGDLKGTKKGTQNSSDQKIEKRLHVEIFQKLNLDKEKTMSVFCFHLSKPTLA